MIQLKNQLVQILYMENKTIMLDPKILTAQIQCKQQDDFTASQPNSSYLKFQKVSSNAETMWDIFSEYGVVEALKVLNSQFKFMCLIKMETIKQALEVMALMHNEEVDERNIQISFTKAKI